MQHTPGRPQRYGLYDPRFEHDSCGVSFVAHLRGIAGRGIVDTALGALCNLDHRATGAEPDTGDGAGILVQIPDRFLLGSSATTSRRSATTPSVSCSCRSRRSSARRRRRRSRASSRTRASPSSPGATCRCVPTASASGAGGDAVVPPARRHRSGWSRHRPRPQDVRRAQAHRARARGRDRRTCRRCRRARSSTRGC